MANLPDSLYGDPSEMGSSSNIASHSPGEMVLSAEQLTVALRNPQTRELVLQLLSEKNEIITIHDGADIHATNVIAPSSKLETNIAGVLNYYTDRIVPYVCRRWLVTLALTALYILWVQMVAFPCFSLGFLWLLMIPCALRSSETEEESFLPIKSSDEFKPFVGCCNEFDLWCHMTFSIFSCTLFTSVVDLNLPSINWCLALLGWIIEALILGSDVIWDVVNHKYVPFDIGRKKGVGKKVCK